MQNLHSFKHSGLAQRKAIGVTTVKGKVALVFSTKAVTKPVAATQHSRLSQDPKKAEKTIAKFVASSHYRPDLKSAALRKYTALSKAASAPQPTVIKVSRSKTHTLL